MEELQTVLNDFNRLKNTTPNADFHCLSSDQIALEPENKAAPLLSSLVEKIGEDGVKMIAKNNLSLESKY